MASESSSPSHQAPSPKQSLTLEIPPGALGIDIQRIAIDGTCLVVSSTNDASPLRVGDIIESINGTMLADIDGGVPAWVDLISSLASETRTMVVLRDAAAADDALVASSIEEEEEIASTGSPLVTEITLATDNVGPQTELQISTDQPPSEEGSVISDEESQSSQIQQDPNVSYFLQLQMDLVSLIYTTGVNNRTPCQLCLILNREDTNHPTWLCRMLYESETSLEMIQMLETVLKEMQVRSSSSAAPDVNTSTDESLSDDSPQKITLLSLGQSPSLLVGDETTDIEDSTTTKDDFYKVLFSEIKDESTTQTKRLKTDDSSHGTIKLYDVLQSKQNLNIGGSNIEQSEQLEQSERSITVELPPGPFGVNIQKSATGECIVAAKTNKSSPLRFGDIIESLNGTSLVDLEGGMWAWVNLITASANDTRTVVIRRGATVASDNVSIGSADDTVVAGVASTALASADNPMVETVDETTLEPSAAAMEQAASYAEFLDFLLSPSSPTSSSSSHESSHEASADIKSSESSSSIKSSSSNSRDKKHISDSSSQESKHEATVDIKSSESSSSPAKSSTSSNTRDKGPMSDSNHGDSSYDSSAAPPPIPLEALLLPISDEDEIIPLAPAPSLDETSITSEPDVDTETLLFNAAVMIAPPRSPEPLMPQSPGFAAFMSRLLPTVSSTDDVLMDDSVPSYDEEAGGEQMFGVQLTPRVSNLRLRASSSWDRPGTTMIGASTEDVVDVDTLTSLEAREPSEVATMGYDIDEPSYPADILDIDEPPVLETTQAEDSSLTLELPPGPIGAYLYRREESNDANTEGVETGGAPNAFLTPEPIDRRITAQDMTTPAPQELFPTASLPQRPEPQMQVLPNIPGQQLPEKLQQPDALQEATGDTSDSSAITLPSVFDESPLKKQSYYASSQMSPGGMNPSVLNRNVESGDLDSDGDAASDTSANDAGDVDAAVASTAATTPATDANDQLAEDGEEAIVTQTSSEETPVSEDSITREVRGNVEEVTTEHSVAPAEDAEEGATMQEYSVETIEQSSEETRVSQESSNSPDSISKEVRGDIEVVTTTESMTTAEDAVDGVTTQERSVVETNEHLYEEMLAMWLAAEIDVEKARAQQEGEELVEQIVPADANIESSSSPTSDSGTASGAHSPLASEVPADMATPPDMADHALNRAEEETSIPKERLEVDTADSLSSTVKPVDTAMPPASVADESLDNAEKGLAPAQEEDALDQASVADLPEEGGQPPTLIGQEEVEERIDEPTMTTQQPTTDSSQHQKRDWRSIILMVSFLLLVIILVLIFGRTSPSDPDEVIDQEDDPSVTTSPTVATSIYGNIIIQPTVKPTASSKLTGIPSTMPTKMETATVPSSPTPFQTVAPTVSSELDLSDKPSKMPSRRPTEAPSANSPSQWPSFKSSPPSPNLDQSPSSRPSKLPSDRPNAKRQPDARSPGLRSPKGPVKLPEGEPLRS